MDIITKSIDLSNILLLNLDTQNEKINNIENETDEIETNISLSEYISKRLNNFFFRVTNTLGYTKYSDKDNKEDNLSNQMNLTSNFNHSNNPLEILKKNNILISSIIDNQNEKLEIIKNKNKSNNLKLNKVLSTFS